jgi:hypothetical protein
MEFTSARPDVIRAINQRWLLKLWTQHLDGARVPRWQAVKPDDLASLQDHLSLLDVTGGPPPRFVIRFHGRMVTQVYGSADYRGRYLDEVVEPERRESGLAPYVQAALAGAPVYTIEDVNDSGGRVIHFERLLLPFARDGETVDRILASLEFVCADGDFDARALLTAPGTARALRLSATIEARAMA